MPIPPVHPDIPTHRPFAREFALRHITPDVLEGTKFRRITRGVYQDIRAHIDFGTRVLATRLVLGPEGVLTGAAAAWALGIRTAGPTARVTVAGGLTCRARSRSEFLVRRESIPADDIVQTGQYGPATSRARTALDLARRLPRADAVAAVDALLNATGIQLQTVIDGIGRMDGARGVRSARQILALCDAGAESVRESALRLLLVDGGITPPVTQAVVRDQHGAFIARVDLGWPRARVAVEYDGAHHETPDRIRRDRIRLNRLRLAGWTVLVVDRHQMRDPDRVVAQVRAALALSSPRGCT